MESQKFDLELELLDVKEQLEAVLSENEQLRLRAEKTEAERAKIFSLLNHSDVLYSDATVSNINGKRKAVILCTNKEQDNIFVML